MDSFGASASRSVSRVKFSEVQHQLSDSSLITSPPGQIAASAAADEDEDSIPASPPKVILFDDEEMTELHPPTTQYVYVCHLTVCELLMPPFFLCQLSSDI